MNYKTTEDLIKALPQNIQDRINAEVEKNIAKWGGVRINSARKTVVAGKVLKFTKRLSA